MATYRYFKSYSAAFASKATDAIVLGSDRFPVHRDIMILGYQLWEITASLQTDTDKPIEIRVDDVLGISQDAVVEFLDRVYNHRSICYDIGEKHPTSIQVELCVFNIASFLQARETINRLYASMTLSRVEVLFHDDTKHVEFMALVSPTVTVYSDYKSFTTDMDIIHASEKAGIEIKPLYKMVPWVRLANSTPLMRAIIAGKVGNVDDITRSFSEVCIQFLDATKKRKLYATLPKLGNSNEIVVTIGNDAAQYFVTSVAEYFPTKTTKAKTLKNSPTYRGLGVIMIIAICHIPDKDHALDVALSKGDSVAWSKCFDVLRNHMNETRPTLKRLREEFAREHGGPRPRYEQQWW